MNAVEKFAPETPLYIITGPYAGKIANVVDNLFNDAIEVIGVRAALKVQVEGITEPVEIIVPFTIGQFVIDMNYYSYVMPEPVHGPLHFMALVTMTERINDGLYETTLYQHPHYVGKNELLKKLAREAAQVQSSNLARQFEQDIMMAYGLDQLGAFGHRLYAKAYNDGHSNGYQEVLQEVEELVRLFDNCNVTTKK